MIVKFKVLQTLKNHMELMVEYGTKRRKVIKVISKTINTQSLYSLLYDTVFVVFGYIHKNFLDM